MANEEITISELELADSVLGDMVMAVDTTSDTKSVTLRQLKAWLGSSLPTGFILPAVGKISDERFTLLDGKTLSRSGAYEAFCNKVIEQVQAGNWFSCTDAEFNADVAAYGQCGRFVITNDYVRIPLITRYIGATVTLSEIGRTYAESLPNITGSFVSGTWTSGGATGAFYETGQNHGQDASGNDSRKIYGFEASRSSSTYQNNAKVNPEHVKFPYYLVISTDGQQEEIEVDINEVYEDLNLKANKDLSNIANVSSSATSLFSSYPMPSNRYDNLTLGASGSTYTAPANGWFGLSKNSGGSGKYIGIWTGGNYSNAIGMTSFATASQGLSVYCPCRKGDSVQVDYSATGTTGLFRFYYAEGEPNV